MWIVFAVLAFVLILVLIWRAICPDADYWKRRGVPFLQPEPFFGNLRLLALGRQSCTDSFRDLYRRLDGHPYGGFFISRRPALLIRDADLVKSILVSDFQHFVDRVYRLKDPLFQQLYFLRGTKWRCLRQRLEPAFDVGCAEKIFSEVDECAVQLADTLSDIAKCRGDVEAKEVIANFVIDAIGACAFGIEFGSINNASSDIVKAAKDFFETSKFKLLKKFIILSQPELANFLGLTFLRNEENELFTWMYRETLQHRKKNNVKRNDFIHLLWEIMNEMKQRNEISKDSFPENELGDEMLAAQMFMFLVIGFEMTSNTLSFCIHELATHTSMQTRLRCEIDGILKRHGGNLSFEALEEMKYLDMVIAETLRLYEPTGEIARECTTSYTIPGTDLTLEAGTPIYIPISGFHQDERHFTNPDVFDPDHFSEENSAKRHPFAYLPFGDGPRRCIGKHFALLVMKLGLVRLLVRYEFYASSQTCIPPALSTHKIFTAPEAGLWLKVRPRIWLPCD